MTHQSTPSIGAPTVPSPAKEARFGSNPDVEHAFIAVSATGAFGGNARSVQSCNKVGHTAIHGNGGESAIPSQNHRGSCIADLTHTHSLAKGGDTIGLSASRD